MSSYHINDLDNYPRTYSFLPNQEKDENGEHLMTQSLVVQAPYRRIRHPELTPVILNRDREDRNYDIMSQSLIVPPCRRIRHTELTPYRPKDYRAQTDGKNKAQQSSSSTFKAPKRAFSMTRLDQLARPRQRYLEEALKLRASKTKENLCFSSVRPTSSMSLVSKQQQPSTTPKSANSSTPNTTANHQNGGGGGTILLRQRTSARKQRPISYAGHSSSSTTNNSPNQDCSTTFSRSSVKAKSSFGNMVGSHHNTKNLHSANTTRNLMVSSIDGSMMSSLSKPTPPRKPAHIKAVAAARKLAKQSDFDQMKKSDSTPRISGHLEISKSSGGTKDRMKKSITNPEKIAELLDEKLNLNDDDQQTSERVIESSDVKPTDVKTVDKSSEIYYHKTTESDNMSNSTFIVDQEDKSSNQICQLIDLGNEDAKVSNETETELPEKTEEEERERLRLENEEMKLRAQDEERKRLAREEKERELERKVKEKAEKARLEMEERLRRDEKERIERKKRLEAIMSRTRKNPSNSTKATSPDQQSGQTAESEISKATELNSSQESKQNPDVVEDAIKSNLIKLTKNENLNNSINNGKTELHGNYIENDTLIESKNLSLINGFKELKMSTNSTFVFSQTSNETTFTHGAN